jgi:putative colanic acid biosynthesis UDP-glucose lipid carrier transferase
MRNNNQSNRLIKWLVIIGDFILLNVIILAFSQWHWRMSTWPEGRVEIFILVNNIALMLSEMRFSTVIHLRLVGAGDILRRIVGLTCMETVLAYVLLKVFDYDLPVGWLQWEIGTVFVIILLLKRLIERWFVKLYREAGRNSRAVTLVGSDSELLAVYEKLRNDSTLGYNILGYYGDESMAEMAEKNLGKNINKHSRWNQTLERLGSMEDFIQGMKQPDKLKLGEELYLCVSRRDSDLVRKISVFCDHRVIRFFYVPMSVESMGVNLKRELLDDMEIFTTYDNPLQNSVNKAIKRAFDIIMSSIFLIPTALMFPFIWLIIKIQSPGPILFKQKRTGLDGRTFNCYKFRSMHVNADADKLQATKDDPRKYPFGNFMRKTNIDELPQFYNVLQGRMSIVGPRPHMLAHTEQYSQLIDKYMVRHFVKPGVTGWAQVTGYRGETKELWQMEERVRRDIWYIEHWSIWLDIRIIWLTAKSMFIHDKNAY